MAVFPGSVATDADLYIAVNNLSALLTDNPLTIGATTVNVNSTTGFPTVGTISIDAEIIHYTGITATSFTGCTRGFDGTSAASHLVGTQVDHNLVAIHHNSLKDEIIAIESFIQTHIGLTTNVLAAEFEFLDGVTSNIQTQLNLKAPLASPTFTGTVTIPTPFTLGATSVTATGAEMNFLVGVTSLIQTQLDGKVTLSTIQTISGAKTFQNQTLLLQEVGGTDVITINVASLAASRAYTLPDALASASFVMTEGTRTINGVATFSSQIVASTGIQSGSTILSDTDDTDDIGSTSIGWQNGYFTRLLRIQGAVSGNEVRATVRNTSDTANSDARLALIVGGTSAGDPVQTYSIGSTEFAHGMDNTDGDSWILSRAGSLGTNNTIRVDGTTGAVTIRGTTTNDNAAAGFVGEEISSMVTGVSAAATGTYSDATSISLTAGDWDVSVQGSWSSAGATWASTRTGLSTTSGNSAAGLTDGQNQADGIWASSSTTPLTVDQSVPTYRVSLSATTTYYLKIRSSYSAGGPPTFGGRIQARRVR